MKWLKYFLYIIGGLILLYILLCLIGPKDLNVTESIVINAPAPIVFNLANSVQEMEQWNEWSKADTTIKTTFNDVASGVGSASSWTSVNSGNGTQKIILSEPYTKVRSQLNFEDWSGDNFAEINISEVGDQSNVSWSFEGTPLPFLFRGMALVTGMKSMMSNNYEKGLATLKSIAEQRAAGIYGDYTIKEEDLDEKHFVMIRKEVDAANWQQFYASNLGILFSKVQSAGVTMKGIPCALFFKWKEDNQQTDMAAAIPVEDPIAIKGTASYSIEAQRAITLDFYGDIAEIEKGHITIDKYMHDRSYLQNPPVIEEYVTNEETENDPNKWLTKITYYFSEAQE